MILLDDAGKSVQVSLDESSGSGFVSEDMHLSSYFSAFMEFPGDYSTAGVVVSFYTSNGDEYKNNHDRRN